MLRCLRQISGVSGLTFDVMRASYIRHFYSDNLNFGARDKLAKVMRHSHNTAARNYNKVFDVENEPTLNPDYNSVNTGLQLKIRELEMKLSSYEDTKDDEKHFKKKRRDIIYNLNTKGRTAREDKLKNMILNLMKKKRYIFKIQKSVRSVIVIILLILIY